MKDGRLVLDFEDVMQRAITVVRYQEEDRADVAGACSPSSSRRPCSSDDRDLPAALQVHPAVFALAIAIGYYVIGQCASRPAHTPLMSVTNAISGS